MNTLDNEYIKTVLRMMELILAEDRDSNADAQWNEYRGIDYKSGRKSVKTRNR